MQIGGKSKMAQGTRRQVYNGSADHTSGGLKKKDLILNKWGRIVSRRKHMTAKKEKRLVKAGYEARKGKFGAVKTKRSGKHSSKSKHSGKSKRHGKSKRR